MPDMQRVRVIAMVVLAVSLGALPARAAEGTGRAADRTGMPLAQRADADHTEAYFLSSDGITKLHADVLRPKGLGANERTPVILTVTPYANHNGSTTDVDPFGAGPNPRFFDFLDLSGALTQGYTYVMVDLPGFGGSGGCNDWGGLREQGAVRAAVEWAASRPWSTGKVALFGKSYDGWTGLMGIAQQPVGLAAVVSMEPVYSGYRYMYMNGVRRPNFAQTMAGFQAYDAKPGRPLDDPEYHATGAPQAYCYAINMAGTIADDSPTGIYWAERDLGPTAAGRTTPLFLTQGFLETNTKPDGAFAYWNGLAGEHNRAWFGQFDHVRGWDRAGDAYETGRSGFVDEVMRFLDHHLKSIEPPVDDPAIAVQDILGRYRAETVWPPADARLFETALRVGAYADTGGSVPTRPRADRGLWTISQPLPHDVWLSGEPVVTVATTSTPNTNLGVNLYDIDQSGTARMISRGVALQRGIGTRSVTFTMYGQDWPIEAGHRIGVSLSSGNPDEFLHIATQQPVTIASAKIALPFLRMDRTAFLDGVPTPRLDSYRNVWGWLDIERLADAETSFALPPPLA